MNAIIEKALMQNLDVREFRDALGSFATGVTIVTAKGRGGVPIGVTASSFNSVSLDPPLVLWSLAKASRSHDDFCESGHFAIHILAADQDDLSNRFARPGGNKFEDIEWERGQTGAPLLYHYAALFECNTRHLYEGGDHVIIVGEVVAYERQGHPPLLFHSGKYAEAREKAVTGSTGSEGASIAALISEAEALLADDSDRQARIFERFTPEEMERAKAFLQDLIHSARSAREQ